MRVGDRVIAGVSTWGDPTAAGITECLITTECILQFAAGGMDTVGYALINTKDAICRRVNAYKRRGVGSKGQLDQAPKEPRLLWSFRPTDSPLKILN